MWFCQVVLHKKFHYESVKVNFFFFFLKVELPEKITYFCRTIGRFSNTKPQFV